MKNKFNHIVTLFTILKISFGAIFFVTKWDGGRFEWETPEKGFFLPLVKPLGPISDQHQLLV